MMAQLAVNGGMTMEEVGDLTWDEVNDIYDYWDVHPPVAFLMEAQVGYKPTEKKKATKESLSQVMSEFGGG
jgi:hypothetical protein